MIAVDTNILVYAHRADSIWHTRAAELVRGVAEHWQSIREVLETGRLAGPKVHDARIAALCVQHGVRELWTADRDFSGMARLVTRNPLVAAPATGK